MPAPRPPRLIAPQSIAIALVLGAALNYPVGWAIVLWSPAQAPEHSRQLPDDWRFFPDVWREVRINYRGRTSQQVGVGVELRRVTRFPRGKRPLVQGVGTAAPPYYGWAAEVRAGWPMLSLTGTAIKPLNEPAQLSWAFAHGTPPSRVRSDRLKDCFLPLRPQSLAFAVNTLGYASGMLAPIALVRWRKRRERANAGKCLACGYDIASLSTCPECGLTRAT